MPDGVPNDAVAVVDAFAVGEFYVRCSGIGPGEMPLVIGAGAIGLSAVAALAARGVGPIIVSDYSDERLAYAEKFGADVLVNPSERSRTKSGGRRRGTKASDTAGDLRMRRRERPDAAASSSSCEFMARVFAAGGWYDAGTIDCTDATHKGVTIQFGGGPHPAGLVRHARCGRRRPP